MKYSNKLNHANEFEKWKGNEPEQNRNYGNCRGIPKTSLEESLLIEQGGVCCYCGRRVNSEPKSFHVEHYLDQSCNPELDLEYENLFISCQRNFNKGDPKICGHKKDKWTIPDSTLKPSIEGCEERFTYHLNGDIKGKCESTKEVVIRLGLNNEILTSPRRRMIKALEEEMREYGFSPMEEIKRLRRRDSEGKLPSFGHVLASYIEKEFGLSAD